MKNENRLSQKMKDFIESSLEKRFKETFRSKRIDDFDHELMSDRELARYFCDSWLQSVERELVKKYDLDEEEQYDLSREIRYFANDVSMRLYAADRQKKLQKKKFELPRTWKDYVVKNAEELLDTSSLGERIVSDSKAQIEMDIDNTADYIIRMMKEDMGFSELDAADLFNSEVVQDEIKRVVDKHIRDTKRLKAESTIRSSDSPNRLTREMRDHVRDFLKKISTSATLRTKSYDDPLKDTLLSDEILADNFARSCMFNVEYELRSKFNAGDEFIDNVHDELEELVKDECRSLYADRNRRGRSLKRNFVFPRKWKDLIAKEAKRYLKDRPNTWKSSDNALEVKIENVAEHVVYALISKVGLTRIDAIELFNAGLIQDELRRIFRQDRVSMRKIETESIVKSLVVEVIRSVDRPRLTDDMKEFLSNYAKKVINSTNWTQADVLSRERYHSPGVESELIRGLFRDNHNEACDALSERFGLSEEDIGELYTDIGAYIQKEFERLVYMWRAKRIVRHRPFSLTGRMKRIVDEIVDKYVDLYLSTPSPFFRRDSLLSQFNAIRNAKLYLIIEDVDEALDLSREDFAELVNSGVIDDALKSAVKRQLLSVRQEEDDSDV